MDELPIKFPDEPHEGENFEAEFADEFPAQYERFTRSYTSRPNLKKDWKKSLSWALITQPILAALQARSLNMLYLGDMPRSGEERLVLGQVLIEWLPQIEDPPTFGYCLVLLTYQAFPGTILENRELIFSLGRKWNIRLPAATEDPTISRLTRIVAIVATDDDIPELFSWIKDRRLAAEVRASYVVKLQRFAKVPGAVRDFLLELLNDQLLGASAVRSLGKALGDGALPIFR